MKKENSSNFFNKKRFLIPILVATLFTFFMVQLSLFSLNNEDLKLPLPNGGGISSIVTNMSLFVSIAIVAIALISLSEKLKKEYAPNFFITIYLVVGTIFILLFGKQFFNVPANSLPLIYIIFAGLAYLGFYSIYLIITGILPTGLKNFIFITYSSIIGMYLGISLPTNSVIAVTLALSFVDIFWVYHRLRIREVNDPMEQFMVVITYPKRRWGIGLGDLTCFAMLITCSFINFGVVNSIFSIILILLGSHYSMKGAEKYAYFPGLPISTGLGAIPILLNSIILV